MSLISKSQERILGVLIEKKYTTPEYYPLTLNSLKNACNQKSNRNPVVNYSEDFIQSELNSLFDKKLVFKVSGAEFRVPKFNENFSDHFMLSKAETAVMDVLMLRGAQTIGEIRGRASRIHSFNNLAEVEEVIQKLISERNDPKFIVKLPRQTGRDPRYVSVLSGEPSVEEMSQETENETDKIDELQAQIDEIRNELVNLSRKFDEFKAQFD